MILIATGERSENALQQAIVFADQLAADGLAPVLDAANLAEDTRMATRYAALRYLVDIDRIELSHVIVLGTHVNDPASLNSMRHLNLLSDAQVVGLGHFETPQDQISAASRLSYMTGRTPRMISMLDLPQITAGTSICPCIGVDIPKAPSPHLRGKPGVALVVPGLEEPSLLNGLQYLTTARAFNTLAYMSGKDKSEWMRMFQPGAHVYGFSEIGPSALSAMSDIVVMCGPIGNNQNALCLLNNQIAAGGAIVDASPDGAFERAGLPVHRGPADLGYLQPFLTETILPNLDGIKTAAKSSSAASRVSLMQILEIERPKTAPARPNSQKSVHFMPTNGIGLGHAQRCVLIAEALKTKKVQPSFFAFPSCLPMINKSGFAGVPLIPQSTLHETGGANDLANYPRLRSKMAQGDVFVFDGGYVFDSVFRTIVERKLSSVWIRRGLWRQDQDNRIPLDREKYFSRVIVPHEAFESLNQNISAGAHIRQVGPVVRQITPDAKSKAKLHEALKAELGVEFDRLIVTMLGSGVVHDMSASATTVCNAVETRDDCLNLLVAWPSSNVPAERYAWTRSKVVKTMAASWLAAHADFVVTAAGYNSFHEVLYNKVPAIIVPQTAQILDDQEARAEAAAELGLAAHVPAGKLSQLDREVRRFLDQGKADEMRKALTDFELPTPGNQMAADLIMEMCQ